MIEVDEDSDGRADLEDESDDEDEVTKLEDVVCCCSRLAEDEAVEMVDCCEPG